MVAGNPSATARSTQAVVVGIRGSCFGFRGVGILKAVLSRCLGLVHVIQELTEEMLVLWFSECAYRCAYTRELKHARF